MNSPSKESVHNMPPSHPLGTNIYKTPFAESSFIFLQQSYPSNIIYAHRVDSKKIGGKILEIGRGLAVTSITHLLFAEGNGIASIR